ncbi:MAG: hypothetical protein MHPSP_004224, partial [Paramarteilia canceri]
MSTRQLKYQNQNLTAYSINSASQTSKFKVQMKLPTLPSIIIYSYENLEFTKEDVEQFQVLYMEHFEASISAINQLQFVHILPILSAFWRSPCSENT